MYRLTNHWRVIRRQRRTEVNWRLLIRWAIDLYIELTLSFFQPAHQFSAAHHIGDMQLLAASYDVKPTSRKSLEKIFSGKKVRLVELLGQFIVFIFLIYIIRIPRAYTEQSRFWLFAVMHNCHGPFHSYSFGRSSVLKRDASSPSPSMQSTMQCWSENFWVFPSNLSN
jgi:hypothetical protein